MMGRVVAQMGGRFIVRYVCPEKDCDFISDYFQEDPSKVMAHVLIHQVEKE